MSADPTPTRSPEILMFAGLAFICVLPVATVSAQYTVTAPPAELKLPSFYAKYCDAGGYPVVSSAKVSDFALKEAAWLIDQMLANRPDVRKAMVDGGSRMIVMAHDEFTTDIPEYSHMKPKLYWDARARGLGGSRTDPVCSCAEENILAFPGDPYHEENILIHEFAHNIHLRGMVQVDETFDTRLKEAFERATSRGLWFGKYASTNRNEYFAEGVQSWFNNNRRPDHDHNHVDTRRELIEYDPGLAELCREVFGETRLAYTKPATRLHRHLAGYDLSQAPTFVWPERLAAEKQRIRREAGNRGKETRRKAKTHEPQTIEGWTVHVDRSLLSGSEKPLGDTALRMLANQLYEISVRLPEPRVEEMRTVAIRLDRDHALKNMQYHPNRKWLVDHGYDEALLRQVHIPSARHFVKLLETYAQPAVVLHELAHGWHDQVAGFEYAPIRDAYQVFAERREFDSVLHLSGRQRRHYALTNHKEYFAEMTETWFGTNDYYPFVRAELHQASPETERLMKAVWHRDGAWPAADDEGSGN